jgi:hypothetical protein
VIKGPAAHRCRRGACSPGYLQWWTYPLRTPSVDRQSPNCLLDLDTGGRLGKGVRALLPQYSPAGPSRPPDMDRAGACIEMALGLHSSLPDRNHGNDKLPYAGDGLTRCESRLKRCHHLKRRPCTHEPSIVSEKFCFPSTASCPCSRRCVSTIRSPRPSRPWSGMICRSYRSSGTSDRWARFVSKMHFPPSAYGRHERRAPLRSGCLIHLRPNGRIIR